MPLKAFLAQTLPTLPNPLGVDPWLQYGTLGILALVIVTIPRALSLIRKWQREDRDAAIAERKADRDLSASEREADRNARHESIAKMHALVLSILAAFKEEQIAERTFREAHETARQVEATRCNERIVDAVNRQTEIFTAKLDVLTENVTDGACKAVTLTPPGQRPRGHAHGARGTPDNP